MLTDIRNRFNLFRLSMVVALTIMTFAVYYNTLYNDFVYDDHSQIIRNPWIKDFRYLPKIFSNHSFGFIEENIQAISYRPMVFAVYMLEYAIFGLQPWGWHLFNFVFHAINSIMVFMILLMLLKDYPRKEAQPPLSLYLPPFIGAALFAAHPVNSEPASWVGCIPELLYTFLCLSAFYVHIKIRDGEAKNGSYFNFRSSLLMAVLFFLALLFKETAVFLPVLLFIYDILHENEKSPLDAGRIGRYVPYAVIALAYFLIRVSALGQMTPAEKFHSYLSTTQYLINASVLFMQDFKALLAPVKVNPFQIFEPVFSPLDSSVLLSMALTVMVPVFFYVFRKKIHPLYFLAASFIVLPLLPTLYAPAVSRFPFADRYLYFPSIGLSLFLSLILKRAINYGVRNGKVVLTWGAISVFAVVAALYSYSTARRNLVWKDDMTLWSASVEGSPKNYFAVYNIGIAYFRKNMMDEGIRKMEAALEINRNSPHPDVKMLLSTHANLARAYQEVGLPEKAISGYNEILLLEPENVSANSNLAAMHQKGGRFNEAINLYKTALQYSKKPQERKEIYNNLGVCYVEQSRWEDASFNYEEALKIAPDDPIVLRNVMVLKDTVKQCNISLDRSPD